MGKRIFWIFMLFIGLSATAAIIYVQSESFAMFAKKKLQDKVAKDLGIELNFDHLKIGVLPPSVSLIKLDLKVLSPLNPLGLATDTVFKAESIGFNFRMFQAFSRGIALNKVFVIDGEINLDLSKQKSSGKKSEKLSDLVHRPIEFQIGDDFSASIRQIELKNISLLLKLNISDVLTTLKVSKVTQLAITPSKEGTNLLANLEEIRYSSGKTDETFKALKTNIDVDRNQIQLINLDAQRKEAAVHASGKVIGSIDKLEDGRPDIDLVLRSPFSELTDLEKSLGQFQGEIISDIKIVGKIKEPAAQGKVSISNFKYSMWDFDKIELIGSYAAKNLILDSAWVSKGDGKLSIRSKVDIQFPIKTDSKSVQLQFSKVKLQDFAGELKKDINNLKLEIDGSAIVKVDLQAEKPVLAGLTVRPDLSIRDLELDNQTFGKARAFRRILHLTPFKLLGQINWKNNDLRISEGKLEFASGVVDVKGGVFSGTGFDITGSTEKINVGAEIQDIAGIPLQSNGAIKIHVRGPSKALFIDFDIKQNDSKFINFDFGDLEGRVTLDDDKSYLYISGLKGRKNSALYQVDGKVNIGDGDDISLAVAFSESDPDDLFTIFAKQLEKISWIPHGMAGKFHGNVSVGGGYSKELDSLEIQSNVFGKNLNYKGELIQEFSAKAGVTKGTIYAKEALARKYESFIKGEIEYSPTNELKYKLDLERGRLRSFDFLSSSGIPLDGAVELNSEGKGKWETLESKTRIDVRNPFIRTKPLPPFVFNYDTRSDFSNLLIQLGSNSTLNAKIANNSKGDSHADFNISDGDFSYILCLINRKNCADQYAQLNIDTHGKFNWKGPEWKFMSGHADLQKFQIGKSGFILRSSSVVPIQVNLGKIESGKLQLDGEDSKIVNFFKANVDGSNIDNSTQGYVSLKLLEFISPFIEEARGKLETNLRLLGNSSSGSFTGSLGIKDGFLRLNGLDAPIDSLNGNIRFNENRAKVESIQGQMGGGSVQVTGGIDVYLNKVPRFNLEMYLANNRLKFFPVNYAEFSEAKLTLTGDKPPYLFGGSAKVKKVMMRNNFNMGSGQKGLQNARYLPEKLSGAKSLYEIRIRASADGGVEVENDLLDAEFKGELTLLNNFEFPQIVARAELVKGKLLFRNTVFTLDHALIWAPDPELFNPKFSIGGTANVDSYKVILFAAGTIDKPKITLSSSPALPQEDLISLLAFGFRGDETRRINPNDTSAITYSEVGSILLEQLRLSQNLQSKGVKLTVTPSTREDEASIIRPNSGSAAGNVSPKLYLQTQITKNLDAAFGGTVGSTQGQEIDANLEYKLGKKAAVSAVYEQEPTGLSANELKSSYGADLKFRWGFK